MIWSNVWAVVRREYVQRVRSKAFVFTTIALPVFMGAAFALPTYFASRNDAVDRRIVVIDSTGVLFQRFGSTLQDAGWEVRSEETPSDFTALRRRVSEGEIGGYLVVGDETLASGVAVFYAEENPSGLERMLLRTAVGRAALERALESSGADVDALVRGGELRVEVLSGGGAGAGNATFGVAYLGAFVLYMVILMYAVAVMRATLEEKTSRIVEIVISSMEPWHLMLGKILGVGAVSLTQLGIWILSGALLGAAGIPALVAARPEFANLGQIGEVLPGLGLIALFVGFFLFGFFMYAGLYACVGAMCNTDQEAQQAQAPVIVFVIAPIVLVIPVIQRPLSAMATGLSLFPLFSPILMWARVAGGGIPPWQVALSFLLMALAVVGIAWVAGRIYKTGILMTGKRPTLPELWRWIREA